MTNPDEVDRLRHQVLELERQLRDLGGTPTTTEDRRRAELAERRANLAIPVVESLRAVISNPRTIAAGEVLKARGVLEVYDRLMQQGSE
jgi:hypothetical protein